MKDTTSEKQNIMNSEMYKDLIIHLRALFILDWLSDEHDREYFKAFAILEQINPSFFDLEIDDDGYIQFHYNNGDTVRFHFSEIN